MIWHVELKCVNLVAKFYQNRFIMVFPMVCYVERLKSKRTVGIPSINMEGAGPDTISASKADLKSRVS